MEKINVKCLIKSFVEDMKYKKMGIRFCKATEENLDEIIDLMQSIGKKKDAEIFDKEIYLKMLKSSPCIMASKDNKAIAILLTEPANDEDIPYTINFVFCEVLPKYKGNDLERKMISYVISILEDSNSKAPYLWHIVWCINQNNNALLNIAEECGFKIYGKTNTDKNESKVVLSRKIWCGEWKSLNKYE